MDEIKHLFMIHILMIDSYETTTINPKIVSNFFKFFFFFFPI